MLPFGSSDSPVKTGTALHLGKDFAVSLCNFLQIIPRGDPILSELASLLAPLELLQTGVTRYPAANKGKCSDFPH